MITPRPRRYTIRPLRVDANMTPKVWLAAVRRHLSVMNTHGTLAERVTATRADMECDRLYFAMLRGVGLTYLRPYQVDDYSY